MRLLGHPSSFRLGGPCFTRPVPRLLGTWVHGGRRRTVTFSLAGPFFLPLTLTGVAVISHALRCSKTKTTLPKAISSPPLSSLGSCNRGE